MKEFEYRGLPNNRIDDELGRQLWEDGMSDAEIAAVFGVRSDTVGTWRRKNGMKPNLKRTKRKKSGLEWLERVAKINEEARAHGMTYGQWNGGGHGQTGH